jgi:hypothetical protein
MSFLGLAVVELELDKQGRHLVLFQMEVLARLPLPCVVFQL